MARWHISTADKKSVEEHEYFEKDGNTIILVTGYRWGSWIVTTTNDEKPHFIRVRNPLGNEDEDSIDMYNCTENNIESTDLESLDDGWYFDIIYPDDMHQDEQELLSELWEENSYEGLESEGWIQTETECWVSCELNVERITND